MKGRRYFQLAAIILLIWMAVDVAGAVPCQADTSNLPGKTPLDGPASAGHVDDCFCCACCVVVTDAASLIVTDQAEAPERFALRGPSDPGHVPLFPPPRA